MTRKSKPPTLLERALAEAASVTPAHPPITAEIRSIVRRLNRGGYAPEQIIEVLSKVGVVVTSEHIATNLAPRSPCAAAPGSLLARFPGRPANTEPLKAAGLKWDRDRKVWAGPDTESARAAIAALGGSVEDAA